MHNNILPLTQAKMQYTLKLDGFLKKNSHVQFFKNLNDIFKTRSLNSVYFLNIQLE